MSAKFELYTDAADQFRFRFRAANGEITLVSESYTSRSGAENGIASVRANAVHDEHYSRETSRDGKHYFNLKAANHQVIGTSETYSSAAGLENGIAELKADVAAAPVEDLTA